ncbi:MAG: calcium-binding protein [Pirellulales bacterium]
MLTFLSNLLGRSSSSRRRVRPRRAEKRLGGFESLEGRRMMAVGAYASSTTGDLVIFADASTPAIVNVVSEKISGVDFYRVDAYTPDRGSQSTYHAASAIWSGKVSFYGSAYDDYFCNYTALRTAAYGYNGNDTLIGSYAVDLLDGGNGRDHLYGNGADDTLYGGWDYSGDVLYGGEGHDALVGSYGGDTIYGGGGNDRMYGYDGNDYLYGENGDDYMFGYNGLDYLDGGLGYDELYGGNDSDSLNGGDDGIADKLVGGAGFDYFQQDWGWKRNYYYGYYYQYNLDSPSDYEPGEGFYNF